MTLTNSDVELNDVLAKFERAVFSPVVPGELVRWTEEAFANTERLQSTLAKQIESGHTQIFETIAATDPEMLSRVEKLRADDDSLVASARELLEAGRTIRTLSSSVDADEERASKLLKSFTSAAETLVIRIKKQELAIEVWLQEAETRDRGVKD